MQKFSTIFKTEVKKTTIDQWFLVGYLVVLSGVLLFKYYRITLDLAFVFFLFGAFFVGRTKQYVRDWLPFVAMFVGYELMRGFADDLNSRVHIFELIGAERALFGYTIPTIVLQDTFYRGTLTMLEYAAIFLYTTHFYLYFVAAFILWLKRPTLFKLFTKGFIFLCFAGFITFLAYPAMPPWLASHLGHLEPVHRIIVEQGQSYVDVGTKEPLALLFLALKSSPNEVAAMPSLHSAWPFFTSLFLMIFLSWRWWPSLVIPFGVWFSVVYLGEHYIIDVIAGATYALVALLATLYWARTHQLLDKQEETASTSVA